MAGMFIREAVDTDIPQMQRVRASVRENTLRDESVVTPEMYRQHLNVLGRGWVCEQQGRIVGLAIVNLEACSIWALFVEPEWEGRGVGRALLDTMIEWFRSQGARRVTLCTEPGTRAVSFYEAAGWAFLRIDSSGEAVYEKALT